MNSEKGVRNFIIVLMTIGIIVLIFGGQSLLIYIYSQCIPSQNFDIGALSSFYSVIFTIVAIIIGIAAIIGWRWIKDEWAEKEKKLNEKMNELTAISEELKDVKEDVKFLKEKSKLAKWVQDLFDKDDKKQILSKKALPISTIEDKEKYKKIEEKILNDATDDSWLNIVYAKKLMEHADKCLKSFSKKNGGKDFSEIQNTYKRVEKIFKFIENRDLFKSDSDIDMNLHNLHGGLYWERYKAEKLEFQKKFQDENKEIPWEEWWRKKDQKEKQVNEEQLKKKHESYNLLKNSEKYYRNALKITEGKNEDDNQTLGNLALVLIELSKFLQKSEKSDILEKGEEFLDRVDYKDFNTYWDSAKVLYYLNPDKNKKEIQGLLDDAVGDINNRGDKNFFIKRLKAELNERIDGKPGFPGDEKIINKLEDKFKNKNLS